MSWQISFECKHWTDDRSYDILKADIKTFWDTINALWQYSKL